MTRRQEQVLIDWLTRHRDDIEFDVNDFGDLKPFLTMLGKNELEVVVKSWRADDGTVRSEIMYPDGHRVSFSESAKAR